MVSVERIRRRQRTRPTWRLLLLAGLGASALRSCVWRTPLGRQSFVSVARSRTRIAGPAASGLSSTSLGRHPGAPNHGRLCGAHAVRAAEPAVARDAVRMSSRSLRAIGDAVYIALFGAPDPLPEHLEEAQATPVESTPPLVEALPPSEAQVLDIAEVEDEVQPVQSPILFSEKAGGEQDFFLFIKDYGWSLRYQVRRLADSLLDAEKPLKLEWVKLRRPVHSPEELLNASSTDLFNWDVREPPSHSGFMYQVTSAVGSGVEAVINFFKGHGVKLLIKPDANIQLTGPGAKQSEVQEGASGDESHSVTHCWVQVMGMPWLPILQSIAFFNLDQEVLNWQA